MRRPPHSAPSSTSASTSEASPGKSPWRSLRELERTPLLVLEDAHWADGATLDVLRALGRRIDGTAAIVLATYRDDEVDSKHPLRIVLGELASAAAVSRISVPRLSFDAVRKLAEPHGADGRAIHRLTCGNAFYVTEILAAAESSLPETMRDAVLARAKTLEPAARRLLDVVSVVPSRAELWLLEAVAGDLIERLASHTHHLARTRALRCRAVRRVGGQAGAAGSNGARAPGIRREADPEGSRAASERRRPPRGSDPHVALHGAWLSHLGRQHAGTMG
ncbi:MAG: hypothetical protein WKF65_13630 [Gaiellaceae bacterium]